MLCALLAGCGSTASHDDAGLDGGTPADAGPVACGLGCPKCDPQDITDTDGLCTSEAACQIDADCAAGLPSACHQNLGTYTYDFHSVGCLGGSCAYRINFGGCSDLTACSACPTLAGCADRASTGACLDCFTGFSGDATLSGFLCPACAACAGSALCGGDAGTSDACANCAIASLTGSGSVLADPAFHDRCLDAGSPSCATIALRVLSCRR